MQAAPLLLPGLRGAIREDSGIPAAQGRPNSRELHVPFSAPGHFCPCEQWPEPPRPPPTPPPPCLEPGLGGFGLRMSLLRAQDWLEGSRAMDAPVPRGLRCSTQQPGGPCAVLDTHTPPSSSNEGDPVSLIAVLAWVCPLRFCLPCPQLRKAEWLTVPLGTRRAPDGKVAQRASWLGSPTQGTSSF